ncbi:potassium channel family protein [Corynebacterium mendelii]|uniref:Potassium channel family protein n=1 Tax=Corynebacterium mendelii TaxID=2765362 RepID=A0A939E182_9CORY|nr:potassium channel family protein [Corynebacterium mendelii]MBN9645099.1 potassium channel family protein [Corynebacterium mendelii]
MPTTHPRSTRSPIPQSLAGFFARARYAYEVLFYPDVPDDAPPQRKWEASVEGPMLVVSVVFLILFTGAALGKTDAFGTQIAEIGMWVTWIIFVIDYVVRLILANPRGKWFLTHLHELLIVALPWFRPLRILRIVPILFLMQRFSAKNQRITVAIYTGAASLLMILVAALSMYDAEYGQPDSHITSFGDALWWSVVTVTTVGYGDITPVTQFGRGIGIFLMIGGIAVAGIVTATVAAWLVQQVEDHNSSDDLQQNLMLEIIALRREITSLRAEVEAATGTAPAAAAPTPAGDGPGTQQAPADRPAAEGAPPGKDTGTDGPHHRHPRRDSSLARWLDHFKKIGPHQPVNGSRTPPAAASPDPASPRPALPDDTADQPEEPADQAAGTAPDHPRDSASAATESSTPVAGTTGGPGTAGGTGRGRDTGRVRDDGDDDNGDNGDSGGNGTGRAGA